MWIVIYWGLLGHPEAGISAVESQLPDFQGAVLADF